MLKKSEKHFVPHRYVLFNFPIQSPQNHFIYEICHYAKLSFGSMIFRGRCPPDRPLHEYRSELTVFGYAREHSVRNVPADLAILMLQYHDLWLRRCFTKKEIARLLRLPTGYELVFPMDNIIVKGTKVRVYLRACCSRSGFVELFVRIALPRDVRFISCIAVEDPRWFFLRNWVRAIKENGDVHDRSGTHHHNILKLREALHLSNDNLKEMLRLNHPISFYLDIN